MTADEFWRDLEARFRALHNEQIRDRSNDVLHAQWSSMGADPDNGNPWSLSGGSARTRTQFEWLAQSAAVRLGHSGGPAAVFTWLDRLKAESAHFKGGITGFWYERKMPKEARTESGWIELLCLASAEYCLRCETQEKIEAKKLKRPEGLTHSDDYTSVAMPNGTRFTLTKAQADVITILHRAFESGNPGVSNKKILETLERETSRLQDIFKSTPGAWKALVKSVRRGVYRLNLPDPPAPR